MAQLALVCRVDWLGSMSLVPSSCAGQCETCATWQEDHGAYDINFALCGPVLADFPSRGPSAAALGHMPNVITAQTN